MSDSPIYDALVALLVARNASLLDLLAQRDAEADLTDEQLEDVLTIWQGETS